MKAPKVGTRELVREVAARQNCYIRDAREVLDHFAAVVAEHLESGRSVHFAALGTFYPIPQRRSNGMRVRFRPAAALRRRLAAPQTGDS